MRKHIGNAEENKGNWRKNKEMDKKKSQEFNRKFMKDAKDSIEYGMQMGGKLKPVINKIVVFALIGFVIFFIIKMILMNT